MAIFHLHVKNISRGEGRSAVAAAAYRAGETLPNEAEEKASAFGGRRGVIHTEIRAPAGAPAWMRDRAELWNRAEAAEHRRDARLAKEIEFALPRELARESWLLAARRMADHYVRQGLVADLAIHDDGTGHNPHVHMLLTTRVAGPAGFQEKLRAADGIAFVHEARSLWEGIANAALAGSGVAGTIDSRSHEAAGISATPTAHRGPNPAERRRRRQEAFMVETGRIRLTQREVAQSKNQLPPAADDQREPSADNLPVPDPEGRPISPAEQDRAERAMIAEMERSQIDKGTEWWLDGDVSKEEKAPQIEDRGQWWEPDR